MEAYADVAPAHNPPYVDGDAAAGRGASARSRWWPRSRPASTRRSRRRRRLYAVPLEWAEKHGIQRWGFHGASHRYIAGRTAELLGNPDAKIISCHLGGSSSLCAIQDGQVAAHQPGHEPADRACRTTTASATSTCSPCPCLLRATGKTLERDPRRPGQPLGLLGLSGLATTSATSRRPPRRATRRRSWPSTSSSPRSATTSGAYLLLLGGADAIVFTGGIGENSVDDARGGLREPRLVRHRARSRRRTRRPRARCRIHAAEQPRAALDHADERGD